ncbi:uncharacterized protein [Venturia canescens]|uniref:uncharacterized protein n=1 Tax=Venturia canescens TaxID=32260 RepID=UPI001C9C626C|nr:uncharacterized protein LOC122410066 [Venturia canescens]
MTMEDRSGGIERAAPASSTVPTTTSLVASMRTDLPVDASYPLQRASKRSFDVAFLVAPDEKLARRQHEKLRLVSTDRLTDGVHPDRGQDEPTDLQVQDRDFFDRQMPQNLTTKHFDNERRKLMQCTDNSMSPPYSSLRTLTPTLPGLSPDAEVRRYTSQLRAGKTPSPPTLQHHAGSHSNAIGRLADSVDGPSLPCGKMYDAMMCSRRQTESRSAFTKVTISGSTRNGTFDDGQSSPRSSISPDRVSYQSSVSPPATGPLPPATGYKYAAFPTAKMPYPFLVSPEAQQTNLLENLKIPQIVQPPKIPSPNKVTGFRPEVPSVYPNFPYNPMAVFPPMAEALTRPRFLATAASVAGLLPPSFALNLPAQNVCAKCNLSFRMTSDLVYHMRSHHKNENNGEAARRRREEKLRCPVCDESFRERHHLTRHMTAHQDKESDAIVDQVEIKRRAATVHGK